jgi:hypothetical protein
LGLGIPRIFAGGGHVEAAGPCSWRKSATV